MQVLLLNDHMRQQVAEMRAYAEQHPFTQPEMEARQLVGDEWAPGDVAEYSREFAPAVKIVFTVESTRSGAMVRHLSVSIDEQIPNPAFVHVLMPLLGFWGGLEDCLIDFTEEPRAIGLLQYVLPQAA